MAKLHVFKQFNRASVSFDVHYYTAHGQVSNDGTLGNENKIKREGNARTDTCTRLKTIWQRAFLGDSSRTYQAQDQKRDSRDSMYENVSRD